MDSGIINDKFRAVSRQNSISSLPKSAEDSSEQELRRIIKAVESASNAIWLTDARGQKVIYHNPAFTNLFGYTGAELNTIGGTRVLYIDPSSADAVYGTVAGGRTWNGEVALRSRDGETLIIALIGDIVTDENNMTVGYLGIATDITAQKKTEEELIDSRQRMADIIDFLPDATMVIDIEGRVIAWNHAMEEMTGVNADQIIGRDNYEHAIPFYGERRPILIDLVFKPDRELEEKYSFIKREKELLIAETRTSRLKGKGAVLWGKANILYDTAGNRVGAIEAIRDITDRIRSEEKLKQSLDDLRATLEGTVNALAETTEKRDPYTAGHQERVARLSTAIGFEMGLGESQINCIRIAAKIHDIGKIHIPADILGKPGIINSLERAMINTHSQVGYEIITMIPFNLPVAEIVLQHHERINGSGYPRGLRKADILLEASIVAVADVVEAMSMHRPYRPALGISKALEEINQKSGILYHEDVVKACKTVFDNGFQF